MTWFELLQQCALIATLILLAAFAASLALRWAPAAWRHFLWTAVLAGLLTLPALVRMAPKWDIERAAAVAPAADAPMVETIVVHASAPRQSWNPWLLVWLAGCSLAAGRLMAGRLRMAWIVRRASDARYARAAMDAAGGLGIRVLESASAPTALAAGILRPVVVLPVDAVRWPVERLRAALLHELMHVRRRDLVAQAVGQMACCFYWFHPLAWLAARQMRREREQACDDAVLGRGLTAHDYAGHLVESVRALRGKQSGVLAMAEPSLLEVRVRALLDAGRDRRPLSRNAALAVVAMLALVLVPLATVTVHAQAASAPAAAAAPAPIAAPSNDPAPSPVAAPADDPAPSPPQASTIGTLAGVVMDPSGARVPNCAVTVRSEDGLAQFNATTDAVGAYQFSGLSEGRYSLNAAVRGFKTFSRNSLQVRATETTTVNVNLAVGSVSEAVSVTAVRPSSAPPAPTAAQQSTRGRIRVGGMVQPAQIIRKVPPIYPADMQAQGITGTVQLVALIGKQGNLMEVHAISGPEGLVAAAVNAVSQWVYQPSLLNGEPIIVETQIDITFSLQ